MTLHLRLTLTCCLLCALGARVQAETGGTVSLPPQAELTQLTDLVAQSTGVSLQYNVGKLAGAVRLSIPAPVTTAELWAIYHQVLASQGFTTVITGLPAVYQVVAITDAAQVGRVLTPEEFAKLPYPPGYQVVVRDLRFLSSESALKVISTLFTNQSMQARALGADGKRLILSAPTQRLSEIISILDVIDRAGVRPGVRLIRPERTSPQTLQASTMAAWNALGRIDEHPRAAEALVAPDGVQLMLIATADDIDVLEKLAHDLDQREPVESRTYRPRSFALEEVASLIEKTLGAKAHADIVRDKLTNSLIITATTNEHARIATLISSLDDSPNAARRQLRIIQVKHRKATEVAQLVLDLVSGTSEQHGSGAHPPGAGAAANQPSSAQAQPGQNAPAPGALPPATGGGPATPPGGGGGGGGGGFGSPGAVVVGQAPPSNALLPPSASSALPTTITSDDGSLQITADPVTNCLLVMGDLRIIQQVERIIAHVDLLQPQVDLELIIVELSEDQSRQLGVELTRQISSGNVTTNVASLFGLSQAGASPVDRTLLGGNGLGTAILHPGVYAGILTALETVDNGKTIIRSHIVVNNNAQATLNGVLQQTVSSVSSTTQLATTSFSGTSDAGTQITIQPQISAADYVTVNYAVSQSSFVGSPTVTANGVIPPNKENDNVASTATIPDGYVIAVGGLSTHTTGATESRIPFLGAIPYLGALFKNQTSSMSDAKFYVFIRPSILRHSNFSDLKYISEQRVQDAGLGHGGEPMLEPQIVK